MSTKPHDREDDNGMFYTFVECLVLMYLRYIFILFTTFWKVTGYLKHISLTLKYSTARFIYYQTNTTNWGKICYFWSDEWSSYLALAQLAFIIIIFKKSSNCTFTNAYTVSLAVTFVCFNHHCRALKSFRDIFWHFWAQFALPLSGLPWPLLPTWCI